MTENAFNILITELKLGNHHVLKALQPFQADCVRMLRLNSGGKCDRESAYDIFIDAVLDFRSNVLLEKVQYQNIRTYLKQICWHKWMEQTGKPGRVEHDSELRQQVQEILPIQSAPRLRQRRILLITSAAAVLLVVIVLATGVFQQDTGADLYAEYYRPYDMLLSERAGQNGTTLDQAITAYEVDDYATAYTAFEAVGADTFDPMVTLYAGISALEINRLSRAEELFEDLLGHMTLREHAQWYLALLHVRRDEPLLARALLEELVETSSYYKEQAGDLVMQLEE